MRKSNLIKQGAALSIAFILIGIIPTLSRADNPSASGTNSGSEVNNIHEDRHDSPSDPTQVTGSVVKMPIRQASTTKAASTPPPITYHTSGPVIINPKVSILWYGNWSNPCISGAPTSSTPAILSDFLGNLASSPWYRTNTLYYQILSGVKTFVSPTVTKTSCTSDSGTLGKSLDGGSASYLTSSATAKGVKTLTVSNPVSVYPGETISGSGIAKSTAVSNVSGNIITISLATSAAIPSGTALTFSNPTSLMVIKKNLGSATVDPNNIYFIFTSADIAVSGFGTTFCGYHGFDATTQIKYSLVGDPSNYLANCTAQSSSSPNLNPAADGMASVVAHELVEAVSDPTLKTWYDSLGNENGDKCAWNFVAPIATSGLGYSNVTAGNRNYLLQANWNPVFNGCFLAIPALTANVALVTTKTLKVNQATTAFTPVTGLYGTAPYTYSWGSIHPSGLVINPNTGAISGTPTSTFAASLVPITITDSLKATATASFTLAVN